MARDFNGRGHHADDTSDSGSTNEPRLILNEAEDCDSASDVSSCVTQLDADDFQSYFVERDGRLFHSLFHFHGGSPYPLPVDTLEQERLDALHLVLAEVLQSNFVGPVQEVLAPIPDRRKRALDVCTGTGQWLMAMASQFTQATFNGFDVVPIATQRPLPNVHFEMHNVNETFRWPDGTMDLVHARYVAMAVFDYRAMLAEAARVLRPGGLFISGEWDRLPSLEDRALDTASVIPNITRLINRVNGILNGRFRALPAASSIPRWMAESGLFRDITHEFHEIPIGDWHTDERQRSLGVNFREIAVRYGDSLRQVLKDAGDEQAVVDELINGYLAEIRGVPGMICVYHTVHAIKA